MSLIEFPRSTPHVANLACRESTRAEEWREKMRCMAIQEAPEDSASFERMWLVVCVVVPLAVLIAAVIVTW